MLTEFEQYLETLCRKYRPLSHLSNTNRRAWLPFGTPDAAPEKGNLNARYVKHTAFEVSGGGEEMYRYSSTIEVLVNAPIARGNAEQAIRDARRTALTIAQAIDARISRDFDNGEVLCDLMDALLPTTMDPIGPVDETAYGYQVNINFSKYKPDIVEEDWE